MKTAIIVYCVLAACVTVCLLAAVFLRSLHLGRRGRRDTELGRQYLRIILGSLMSGEGEIPVFPRLYCFGGRLVLAETLAQLSATTYGLDPEPLRRIVELTDLEHYLLRRARRTAGYRRAWFLSLLANLRLGSETSRLVARYGRDRNRSVRFYALMVQIACDPDQALRLIADYSDPLSAFEQAEIIALLRRGELRIAYEPLIESPERNLRSLGLCIVRQFGIEEAEKSLLRIIATDETPELSLDAIYSLCTLQRPLRYREVARRVTSMTPRERKSLLRYMALEGYAGDALDGLFDKEDKPYFDALVNSYKRPLVCL